MLDNLAAELSFWRWVAAHFDEYMERHASGDELATLTPERVATTIQSYELAIATESQRKVAPHELHRTPTHHPVAAFGDD